MYCSAPLQIPVLCFIAGDHDGRAKYILEKLGKQLMCLEGPNYRDFAKKLKSEHKFTGPDAMNASYIPCKNISEFIGLRERLRDESQLFFLTCYSVLILIDVAINRKSFKEIREQTKSYLLDSEVACYVYYRADVEYAQEHNDTTFVAFSSYGEETTIDGIHTLAMETVLNTLRMRFTSLPQQEDRRRKALDRLIISNTLWFCSTDRSDIIKKLGDVHKAVDGQKDADYAKMGAVYEILGLFELAYPGALREEKVMDKVASISNQWPEIDLGNDAQILFCAAVEFYSRKRQMDKVCDAMIRLVKCGASQWIDKCTETIANNYQMPHMQSRAWELMSIVVAQKKPKKAAFLAYLFNSKFKSDDQRIDFLLEAVRLIRSDEQGPAVIRDLCVPMVLQLLTSPFEFSKICALIFDTLSIGGTFFTQEQQGKLFNRLARLCRGDMNLTCNLDFKIIDAEFADMPLMVKRDTNSSGNSGPFIYSYLANSVNGKKLSMEAGIGWPVRIAVDIMNPYAIDLPFSISAPYSAGYDVSEFSVNLENGKVTRMECCITPTKVGEYEISYLECRIYQGLQKINLPRKLVVTVVDDTVRFTCRTDLSVDETLKVFVGEQLTFNVWMTNIGNTPIESFNLHFIDARKMEAFPPVKITEDQLPVEPSCECSAQVSLHVKEEMKQINCKVIATATNPEVQSIISLIQPLDIEPGLYISALEPVLSLPDMSPEETMFIAVDITNSSDLVFMYHAKFGDSDRTAFVKTFNAQGLVTSNTQDGILGAHQTTVAILAISKELLRNSITQVEQARIRNAYKQEEARMGRQISKLERPGVTKRAGIGQFLEENLTIEWACGSVRKGSILKIPILPSPELLEELETQRPKLEWSFMNKDFVRCGEEVELVLKYHVAKVRKCAIVLGKYMDPGYGIAWDGTLEQICDDGTDEFRFVLIFTQPGKFDIHVDCVTVDDVKGKTPMRIDVQE